MSLVKDQNMRQSRRSVPIKRSTYGFSLKALDPNRPIREADIRGLREGVRGSSHLENSIGGGVRQLERIGDGATSDLAIVHIQAITQMGRPSNNRRNRVSGRPRCRRQNPGHRSMILPYDANPGWMEFSERTGCTKVARDQVSHSYPDPLFASSYRRFFKIESRLLKAFHYWQLCERGAKPRRSQSSLGNVSNAEHRIPPWLCS
jgi:hypothetical protein